MNEIREIYKEAFGESGKFDDLFFEKFGSAAKTLKADGKIVSVLFLLPCFINGKKIYYIYAAATKKTERKKGYMGKLLETVKAEIKEPLFLKPAKTSLIAFYEKAGFKLKKGVNKNGDIKITVSKEHEMLSALCSVESEEFNLMFWPDLGEEGKTFEFPYTMQ